jgi:hypothetical protein
MAHSETCIIQACSGPLAGRSSERAGGKLAHPERRDFSAIDAAQYRRPIADGSGSASPCHPAFATGSDCDSAATGALHGDAGTSPHDQISTARRISNARFPRGSVCFTTQL